MHSIEAKIECYSALYGKKHKKGGCFCRHPQKQPPSIMVPVLLYGISLYSDFSLPFQNPSSVSQLPTGVCLAPGFLNDHSGQFAWIPFDCKENFSCVLCTHKNDQRESLDAFITQLKVLYKEAVAVPY